MLAHPLRHLTGGHLRVRALLRLRPAPLEQAFEGEDLGRRGGHGAHVREVSDAAHDRRLASFHVAHGLADGPKELMFKLQAKGKA